MSETRTSEVVGRRVLGAPPEEVWKAWSVPDHVAQWWGPAGFTCPSAEMDFREGGSSLVCMRAPAEYGGMEMYNTWTYRRIEPHSRIEFDLAFTDADRARVPSPPGVPEDVRHVVTLTRLGSDRTELTVTEYGYTLDEARDLSAAGLEECLDKMESMF